ncbi:MAG: sulfite exporter TauE/SafE family protein [Dehalococcoidia bacterium]
MDTSQALEVWWVFPVAVGIATLALSSGISGALFFSPFFLLVVGLEPAQAIGAGLMTELFGTGFGTNSYVRQRVVDYRTVRFLLMASVPAGILGAILAHRTEPGVLQIIFGAALVLLAVVVLSHNSEKAKPPASATHEREGNTTVIRARDGNVYTYKDCRRSIGVSLAGLGGFLTGLISAGLPEITTTQLMLRCQIPPRVAVATAIFVLSVTVFFAAAVHALVAQPAWHVVIWSIPGVIIGAQIGPRLAGKVRPQTAERVLGLLFGAVGALVLTLQVVK